jgi:rare lipoprotein A
MNMRTLATVATLVLLSTSWAMAETMNTSWYGPGFHGKRTASGERFNQNAMTAAHRKLPFGTRLRLTNPMNGHTACVVINDRGPFIGGRQLDVSKAVATKLGFREAGTARLEVRRGC